MQIGDDGTESADVVAVGNGYETIVIARPDSSEYAATLEVACFLLVVHVNSAGVVAVAYCHASICRAYDTTHVIVIICYLTAVSATLHHRSFKSVGGKYSGSITV